MHFDNSIVEHINNYCISYSNFKYEKKLPKYVLLVNTHKTLRGSTMEPQITLHNW